MRKKQVADTRAMAGRPPPSWRPWLEGSWEEVNVAYAEARRGIGAGGGGFRIRVVVHLGALLPADVQVECGVRGRESGHSASGVRLWSAQSYGNGAFVYEGTITDDTIGDVTTDDLVVYVSPAPGDWERSSVAPVVAAVRPVRSGSAPEAEVPEAAAQTIGGNVADDFAPGESAASFNTQGVGGASSR